MAKLSKRPMPDSEAIWTLDGIPISDHAAKEIYRLRQVLEELACLGNGEHRGNSIGNTIAIKALEK